MAGDLGKRHNVGTAPAVLCTKHGLSCAPEPLITSSAIKGLDYGYIFRGF